MDALSLENIMYRHGLLELAFDDIASLALDGEGACNLLTKDFFLSSMCEAERQVIKAALPSKTALKQLLSGVFSNNNDGLGDQCLMQGWIMTIEERHNRTFGPALYGVSLSEKARSHALELEHSLQTLFTRQIRHSFPQRPISATAKIFGSKPCLLPDDYALQGPNEGAFLHAVKAASTNNTCKQNQLVAKLDEKALTYYVAITRLAQTQAELSGDTLALLRYRLKEQRENEKRVTRKLRATLEQQISELKLNSSFNPKILLEKLDSEVLNAFPKQQT